jgi:hypothetical protein
MRHAPHTNGYSHWICFRTETVTETLREVYAMSCPGPGKQGYLLATIATLLASIDQQLSEQGDSLAAIVNIARVDRQQLASIDE